MLIRSSHGKPRRSHAESLHRFSCHWPLLAVVLAGCSRNPDVAKKKYLESGMKYMDQQKYDSAVIQFKKAIQIDPKYAEAHYQLAGRHEAEQNQEAFKRNEPGGRARSQPLKARVALGGMYLASGSHFYSQRRRAGALRRRSRSQQCRRLTSCWAMCCWRRNIYDDALAAFSKAIAIKPTDRRRLHEPRRGLRLSEAGRRWRKGLQEGSRDRSA